MVLKVPLASEEQCLDCVYGFQVRQMNYVGCTTRLVSLAELERVISDGSSGDKGSKEYRMKMPPCESRTVTGLE